MTELYQGAAVRVGGFSDPRMTRSQIRFQSIGSVLHVGTETTYNLKNLNSRKAQNQVLSDSVE